MGVQNSRPNSPAFSCCCCTCINTSEVGVVERFGSYQRLLTPGFQPIFFPVENLVASVSTRIQQLNILCETKTKDNVFVEVGVAVQYAVIPDQVYDAVYKLTDAPGQIERYVYDVIRSTVPKLTVDESFENKTHIADEIQSHLEAIMKDYGYTITTALVTDLRPDQRVKAAMNEINANNRLRQAAQYRAEADKITQVKAAEAEAESKYLSGVGVARQRAAIVDGLKSSIVEFADSVDGTGPKDVMNLLLLTQYFDMLKDVSNMGSNTMFISHGPAAVGDIHQQLRMGLMYEA